jgi:cyclophilin family peptidyl-prolyl cis-trans isomerase
MKVSRLILLFTSYLLLCTSTAYAANPQIRITTNLGVIDVELYADKAPQTVKNILDYVDNDFYTDTIFHRVIDNFMIQGGGYTADYQKKAANALVQNEAYNGLKNQKGTLAMARTSDPHSASAQFFINVRDNHFLDFELAPYGPLNTVRQSQLGIQDSTSGRIATTNCRGQRITRDTLKAAQKSADSEDHGYICLMRAILNDNAYSLDGELKSCLSVIDTLKQSGKLGKDQTCSDYVNNRHMAIKLVHVRWGYTVFGKVTHGYNVVEKIKGSETGPAGPFRQNAPKEPVIIQSIKRIQTTDNNPSE